MIIPRISLSEFGFYVTFRYASESRDAIGFVIKRRSQMLFSERYGYYRRAFMVGPFYFRTFARRAA